MRVSLIQRVAGPIELTNGGTTGRVTSTVKLQIAVFPELSVATSETGVIPVGKTLPFGNPVAKLITGTPQLSVADESLKNIDAPHNLISLAKTILSGQSVKTGASVSITFTKNEQVEVFEA